MKRKRGKKSKQNEEDKRGVPRVIEGASSGSPLPTYRPSVSVEKGIRVATCAEKESGIKEEKGRDEVTDAVPSLDVLRC